MVSFLKIFQIFVQSATEFPMSVLTSFLFGKILISNKAIPTLLKQNLCANHWYSSNIYAVDIR